MRKKTIVEEAQEHIGGNHNFSLDSLDWNVRVWVGAMGLVMEDRLEELEIKLRKEIKDKNDRN